MIAESIKYIKKLKEENVVKKSSGPITKGVDTVKGKVASKKKKKAKSLLTKKDSLLTGESSPTNTSKG